MNFAPVVLQGAQRPRVASIPPSASSTAEEAIELCETAGLRLDPWQEFVLANSLGEREDGRWAAFEVGLLVPRQNGKGTILEARELVGLFLLEEPLIIHTAHLFDTSLEHFNRLLALIEDTTDFDSQVKRVSRSHGEEGIELKNGSRIRFRTRTKGGGRGFTGDLVVFDEAMEISEKMLNATVPTLAARSISGDPQVWYAGTAVDQWTHDHGTVFARVRERGHSGKDPRLAYFDWSLEGDNPETVEDASDPEKWAIANPGLGIRISDEYIEMEQRILDGRGFAVERLGVGDWPRTDGEEDQVIDTEAIARCQDADSKVLDPVAFSFDVTPDRSYASIGVAGKRADALGHIEVVDRRRGTHWVVDRLIGLVQEHATLKVLCDAAGPASSLLAELEPKLEQLGIELEVITAGELARACGLLYDDFQEGGLRHLGTPELVAAMRGARKRLLGESWAWSRKNSAIDISPLVACTLAHWGAYTEPMEAGFEW